MDVAYNQHADRARRKIRSLANPNHLTLAPLTVKLPIEDSEDLHDANNHPRQITSYLQGKSAPTTPRLLSHSPAGSRSRSHHRTGSAPGVPISKSKSSSQLAAKPTRSGTNTPRRRHDEHLDPNDSDWLLRAGALMSNEFREYKGQNWLVSRQSSTSLAGMRDPEEEAFEIELARERDMASRRQSRRGSAAADSDMSSHDSRFASRTQSLSHSMFTPGDRHHDDSYFPRQEALSGPDFVNLDSKLEKLEQDTSQADDEAMVRRLVRRGQHGRGTWIGNMIGWSLFSVEENDEDSEDSEDDVEEGESMGGKSSQTGRLSWSVRHFEGASNAVEDSMPPPEKDEGGWKDAAWLLSVASKVMF